MRTAKTILIVEDNPEVANALVQHLEREGYICERATDGDEALAAVRRHPPDLVLLDRGLPGVPGDEVARQLRADPRCSSTPVIMVTGKAEESDELVGFAVGADDYISKPFSPKLLLARVEAQLRKKDRAESTHPSVPSASVKLDRSQPRAFVDRTPVPLTADEYKILATMIAAGSTVLEEHRLAAMVYPPGQANPTKRLAADIEELRHKLGTGGGCIQLVGPGMYAFCHPRDPQTPA